MSAYCVECDTTVTPCPKHPTADRYLDPIEYEAIVVDGARAWSVPDAERDRWEHPVRGKPRPIRPTEPERPVDDLVAELESTLYLSSLLEAAVRAAYATNPTRTTRLVAKVIAGVRDDTFGNPEGYLMKHATAMSNE